MEYHIDQANVESNCTTYSRVNILAFIEIPFQCDMFVRLDLNLKNKHFRKHNCVNFILLYLPNPMEPRMRSINLYVPNKLEKKMTQNGLDNRLPKPQKQNDRRRHISTMLVGMLHSRQPKGPWLTRQVFVYRSLVWQVGDIICGIQESQMI